uniref:Uncharacterized protein n=1 Tax=Tanacetum cinerariifolium TaxID=118510 RepID=A0A6L2JN29_TANCI|nr:hypothetical protein [Tanacetum cinerariifolium]
MIKSIRQYEVSMQRDNFKCLLINSERTDSNFLDEYVEDSIVHTISRYLSTLLLIRNIKLLFLRKNFEGSVIVHGANGLLRFSVRRKKFVFALELLTQLKKLLKLMMPRLTTSIYCAPHIAINISQHNIRMISMNANNGQWQPALQHKYAEGEGQQCSMLFAPQSPGPTNPPPRRTVLSPHPHHNNILALLDAPRLPPDDVGDIVYAFDVLYTCTKHVCDGDEDTYDVVRSCQTRLLGHMLSLGKEYCDITQVGRMAAVIRNLLDLRYLDGDCITEISTRKIEGTVFAPALEGM